MYVSMSCFEDRYQLGDMIYKCERDHAYLLHLEVASGMIKMQHCWLIISILAISAIQSESTKNILEQLSTNNESPLVNSNVPISTAIENLAYNTAFVADEISLQVSTKLERAGDILHGGIEMLIDNALEQLSQPIYQATNKLNNENCKANFTLTDLRSNVDLRLNSCTEELNSLLQKYKSDAESSISSVEHFVNKIINLPKACSMVGESSDDYGRETFVERTNCFFEGMTILNDQFSNELNIVGVLLSRARQQSQQSEAQAVICIETFIKEVVNLVDENLKDC